MLNNVLVVEDEQILANNLQAYLGAQGLQVRVALDGNQAIGTAADFDPKVIVLDYRLPDMTGFQVIEAVRENKDCHFVLITAHPTAEVVEQAGQLGVSHILFKPFPLSELARAVCDLAGVERDPRPTDQQGFVERRQCNNDTFPQQMYDGTWVMADRRKAPAAAPANEGDCKPGNRGAT